MNLKYVDFEITIVNKWDKTEIVELYRDGNWWDESWNPEEIGSLIKGSFIFAVAVDKSTNSAIGMGRIISDGVSDGYIQDLVVKKDYRKLGIGKCILNTLVKEAQSKGLTWIGLIAEPETS